MSLIIKHAFWLTISQDQPYVHDNLSSFVGFNANALRKSPIPSTMEAKITHYQNWSNLILEHTGLQVDFQKVLQNDPKLYLGSKGIGCMISHYMLWKKIASLEDGYYLICEDKSYKPDIANVLNNYTFVQDDCDLIDINCRGGNGTESYIVHTKFCKTFTSILNDRWDWHSEVDDLLFRSGLRGFFDNWMKIPENLKDQTRFKVCKDSGWVRYVQKGYARNLMQPANKARARIKLTDIKL